MADCIADSLTNFIAKEEKKGRFRLSAELSKISWFKTGGAADLLFIPKDAEALSLFIADYAEFVKRSKIKANSADDVEDIYDGMSDILVIGVCSNILLPDAGWRGLVIKLGAGFNYINVEEDSDAGEAVLIAGCSVLDTNFALFAASHGIAGFEFLSGIPGTIGGAVFMNAGCYNDDISGKLISVKAVHKRSGEIRSFMQHDLGYSYRSRTLADEWIFVEAKLRGYKDDPDVIKEKMKHIKEAREKTQPIKSKTCGSTFKNPAKEKAWKLIADAGCRDLRVGGASVSDLHANFIINAEGGNSADIKTLIEMIEQRVFEYSGVKLEREIIVL